MAHSDPKEFVARLKRGVNLPPPMAVVPLASVPSNPIAPVPAIKRVNVGTETGNATSNKGGVGTEIRKLLKSMGVADSVKCGCKEVASLWDQRGVDWCIAHKDDLVRHLVNQATERNWLLSVAAKMFAWDIVEQAIKNVTTKR